MIMWETLSNDSLTMSGYGSVHLGAERESYHMNEGLHCPRDSEAPAFRAMTAASVYPVAEIRLLENC
jgi:hypothetical protein